MDLFDMDLQDHLIDLQHQKHVANSYAAKGSQIKAYLQWLEVGNQASKEFFSSLRAHHSIVGMNHIQKDQ